MSGQSRSADTPHPQAVVAHIHHANLEHNLQVARLAAPGSQVMAVIKADAYGHGMLEVLPALSDADAFAVARVDEAVQLRQAGVKKPLLVLGGFTSLAELGILQQLDIQTVIHSLYQLELIQSQSGTVSGWVKLDTGMNRLGLDEEAFGQVMDLAAKDKKQRLQIKALMTHLACADDPRSSRNIAQIRQFDAITRDLNYPQSIANSAAILGLKESHRQWIRPGLMLYGLTPFDDLQPHAQLRPAMTLTAPLLSVKWVRRGEAVGYGATWQCQRDSLIGVVAAGYGDGYPRWMPSGAPVRVSGERAYLAGRVSMDLLTVDLTDIAERKGETSLKLGMPVTLFGEGLPAEELARAAGTIPYVLTTGLTPRTKRGGSE